MSVYAEIPVYSKVVLTNVLIVIISSVISNNFSSIFLSKTIHMYPPANSILVRIPAPRGKKQRMTSSSHVTRLHHFTF